MHEHHKAVKALGKDKPAYEKDAIKAMDESERMALRTSSVVRVAAWLRKNGGCDGFVAAGQKRFPEATL